MYGGILLWCLGHEYQNTIVTIVQCVEVGILLWFLGHEYQNTIVTIVQCVGLGILLWFLGHEFQNTIVTFVQCVGLVFCYGVWIMGTKYLVILAVINKLLNMLC